MNYLVQDAQGNTVNIVEWDGETQYDPGPGLHLSPAPEGFRFGEPPPKPLRLSKIRSLLRRNR